MGPLQPHHSAERHTRSPYTFPLCIRRKYVALFTQFWGRLLQRPPLLLHIQCRHRELLVTSRMLRILCTRMCVVAPPRRQVYQYLRPRVRDRRTPACLRERNDAEGKPSENTVASGVALHSS